MKKVLIAGKNESIDEILERLINDKFGYSTMIATSLEEVIFQMKLHTFNIILIGSGFSQEEEKTISEKAKMIFPRIKIVEHYGGGSGLLLTELEELDH